MRTPSVFSRRLRIVAAVLLVLVGAYAAAGFWLVPKLARTALTEQLAVDGRQLQLGRIAFNPFTFEAAIDDFALRTADGDTLLAFQAFDVDVAVLASAWQRGAVLTRVALTAPYAHVIRNADGTINLQALVPPAKDEPAPAPAQTAPLPRVVVAELALHGGKVEVEDRSRPQPFTATLTPIDFTLRDFRTAPAHDNDYAFTAAAETGEKLDWSGHFSLQPLRAEGRLKLDDVQATTLDAYLQDQLPVRLRRGVAALSADYTLTLDPSLALNVTVPAVTVRDFALSARNDNGTTPIEFAGLTVTDIQAKLPEQTVNVGSVTLDGLSVTARRAADGTLSLSQLMPAPKPAAKAAPEGDTAAAKPWQVEVGPVKLADASIAVEDRAVQPAAKFTLAPVNLAVEGVTTAPDATLKLNGDARINRSAKLAFNGTVRPQPLNAALTLKLDGFELAQVQSYLAPYVAVQMKSGQLGAALKLRYADGGKRGPQLAATGDIGVANLQVQNAAKQDLLKWRRLDVSGLDYHQNPAQLKIDRISLRSPYTRVAIERDRSLNVAQVLRTPAPEAAPSAAPATPPANAKATAAAAKTPAAKAAAPAASAPAMPIRIGSIRIDDGSANFADYSIDPQFATGIVGLAGQVTGLSTDPASRAKVHFEGRIDEYSPVAISGEINPLAANQYLDLALSFSNIDLTIFNPYSGRFAGYDIAKGKLTTQIAYKIEQRKLDAKHHVVVDQLEFGAATGSKEAVPLPIRFVVSLLKDRNGVIELDLPVAGSLDDPQFKIGPLIWKVFVNLAGKIIDAPFKAIGALFGGGEELQYIDFAAGSAELDGEGQSRLAKLSSALASRPQLRLDVPLVLADNLDRGASAERALAEKLGAAAAGGERMKALEAIYRELFQKAPDYPPPAATPEDTAIVRRAYLEAALLQKLTPDEAALQQLAKDRARAVQSALLAHPDIAAERIFITVGRDEAPVEQNLVRMKLKLK